MGEVAVHLQHEVGTVRKRAAKAGEVRGPEALLVLAVKDVHVIELLREPVCQLARPVGGVVVDHENAHTLVA